MKKILVPAFLAAFLVYAPCIFAGEVGSITYVEGRVDVSKADFALAVPVRDGDDIAVKDIIRTKSDSKAEITFRDGSKLRLAQNSRVEVTDFQLDKDNKRASATIKLERGKIRTIIAKMADRADFSIITPNAEGTVKGSDIFAFYEAGSSGVLVAEGNLSIKSLARPENSFTVAAGNSAFINVEGLAAGPRPYLASEKKVSEEETFVPPSAEKKGETSAIKGIVVKMSGDVKVTSKGAAAPHKASYTEVLGEGDSIETGDGAIAEIKFDNGCGLSLKPNTHVTITKMVIDPRTGEYQNLFDASRGKIKARIENLKDGSTFEIKTPTAICGARGTIMYLDILLNSVRAFFEGGNGYMMNLISGASTDIDMGYNGYADNQGNNSTPDPTSDEERMGWTEGWDSDNGTSGYSAPGADDSPDDVGGTPGGNTGADDPGNDANDTDETGGNLDNLYILPPEDSTPPPPAPATFNGGAFVVTHSSVAFLDSETFWTGRDAADGSASGEYDNPNNYTLWKGDFESTVNETKVLGSIGGVKSGDMQEGLLYALYVRPNGEAGYLYAHDLTGSFDPSTGEFLADAILYASQQGTTTVLPEDLYYGSSSLNNDPIFGVVGGDLSGTMEGESISLRDPEMSRPARWGIWKAQFDGAYTGPLSANWSAVAGGSEGDEHGPSFWITRLNGTEWSDGKLHGTVEGAILSYNALDDLESHARGVISGKVLGDYGLGSWQAIGAGTFNETPLVFGGETTHETGVDYALFGGTESLWSESPASVLFIGDYLTGEAPSGSLWKFHTVGRTDDGAAIYGAAGGTNLKNVFKGLMYAIYVKPDGEVGYITSTDISGNIYPDIGMFEADGSIIAASMGSTTITPDQIYDGSADLGRHDLSGLDDHGGFATEDPDNDIYLSSGAGEAFNIADQNWGVWKIVTVGTYEGPTYDIWDVYDLTGPVTTTNDSEIGGAWLGGITGFRWSGNEIKGNLDVIWIELYKDGTLSGRKVNGETIGTYIEVGETGGTWKAASACKWIEVNANLANTPNIEDLNDNIIALGEAANVPITVAYSSLMSGSSGALSASMNTSFYTMGPSMADGIWAAIINGSYSSPPTPSWTLNVGSEGGDSATLTGTKWADGHWAANVAGTGGAGSGVGNFTGTAGGTYDGATAGSFSGAAVGTFTKE